MAHVKHDAQVRRADLLDAQERPRGRAEGHVIAWFLELVLDRELPLRRRLDHLPHPVELEVPDARVVGLERVVIAVLARART